MFVGRLLRGRAGVSPLGVGESRFSRAGAPGFLVLFILSSGAPSVET